MQEQPTIGVATNGLAGDFMNLLLGGIHAVASQQGYRVLAIQSSPRTLARHRLAHSRVAGWIAIIDTDGLEELAGSAPAVIVASPPLGPRFPALMPDNRGGARAAVRHLIEHGHTRIGFAGYLDNLDMAARYQSYQETLREHGLEPDPALVVQVPGYTSVLAREAAAAWLAQGPDCTALFVAADEQAFGVLDALSAAGLRVPEDLAIASFDDVSAAQHARPPLTSVRQQPAELGRAAAQLLVELIGGREATPEVEYIPTALVQRRSCGCEAAQADLAMIASDAAQHADDWRADTAHRLARIISHPLPLPSDMPPTQVWPEMAILIGALESALSGAALPDQEALVAAWGAAIATNDHLETLLALAGALDHRAALLSADAPAGAALGALGGRLRLALFEARLAAERERTSASERALRANYHLSLTLTSGDLRAWQRLQWLRETTTRSACLVLWEDASERPALLIDETYGDASAARLAGLRIPADQFPPQAFVTTAPDAPDGYIAMLPVVTDTRDWGYLALVVDQSSSASLTSMSMWLTLLGAALARGQLESELHAERETLRDSLERERILADTVRELGCPIIPLRAGMLLVPLIGVIDSRRAEQIVETILEGIGRYRAVHMLIDITGVPIVDTHVAGLLIQTTRAAQLLGARAALVGVRPEIAQSIVALGVDLSPFTTYPTLASALAEQTNEDRRPAAVRQPATRVAR